MPRSEYVRARREKRERGAQMGSAGGARAGPPVVSETANDRERIRES